MITEQILFTIGYEGMDQAHFLTCLRERGITLLADVRELPLSRKPGFSRRALAAPLHANAITYVHFRALGCPRWMRARFRHDHDWDHYSEDYLRYLATQAEVLQDLAQMARRQRTALMCFEADAQRCHRSLIAAALRESTQFRTVDLAL